jgi:hypothetical protein
VDGALVQAEALNAVANRFNKTVGHPLLQMELKGGDEILPVHRVLALFVQKKGEVEAVGRVANPRNELVDLLLLGLQVRQEGLLLLGVVVLLLHQQGAQLLVLFQDPHDEVGGLGALLRVLPEAGRRLEHLAAFRANELLGLAAQRVLFGGEVARHAALLRALEPAQRALHGLPLDIYNLCI